MYVFNAGEDGRGWLEDSEVEGSRIGLTSGETRMLSNVHFALLDKVENEHYKSSYLTEQLVYKAVYDEIKGREYTAQGGI
jgi:hypothetical protein